MVTVDDDEEAHVAVRLFGEKATLNVIECATAEVSNPLFGSL
jgi:hypothetical protein